MNILIKGNRSKDRRERRSREQPIRYRKERRELNPNQGRIRDNRRPRNRKKSDLTKSIRRIRKVRFLSISRPSVISDSSLIRVKFSSFLSISDGLFSGSSFSSVLASVSFDKYVHLLLWRGLSSSFLRLVLSLRSCRWRRCVSVLLLGSDSLGVTILARLRLVWFFSWMFFFLISFWNLCLL
jgi:hypothetical protein